jgi:type II secretory pathway component GspD/PulD (secretin)
LFRNVDQIASKKELVLLITPRIITNPMEGVAATEEQMDNLPLEVKEW